MTTYARVDINGIALDVVVSPPTLASRFNADWLSRNPFTQVPDNDVNGNPLQHGSVTHDGGVTFTNPPDHAPQFQPIQLDHQEQQRAMVLGRARALDKKGMYNEASALRATLGD